jgi:prolyl 4-hydroxylase
VELDESGQRYTTHHDHAEVDSSRPAGARALTFFLYLTDVEEGGETNFPLLNISVKPKRGKAVLWPNTLSHNLHHIDSRMYHQALPVIQGVKYAANVWIHLYDYETPNRWACTGTMG